MKIIKKDAVVIGAGPAGTAAAEKLHDLGVTDIIVLEKEARTGGILPQCVHDGFGLMILGKNITGPEYAEIFDRRIRKKNIDVRLSVTVMSVTPLTDDIRSCREPLPDNLAAAKHQRTPEYLVRAEGPEGPFAITARTVITASGCHERSRGSMMIPGSRASGIWTAGTAQNLINLKGLMTGRDIVILGSGDIGLIMARRFTLEGAHVICVLEREKTPGGLKRNIRQCLDDYDIPLRCSATVTDIIGSGRISAVKIMEVAADGSLLPGTEETIRCDTLVLSAGLEPENAVLEPVIEEMSKQTAEPEDDASCCGDGIFVCGNALYVHGLADDVTQNGRKAAVQAAKFLSDPADAAVLSSPYTLRNISRTRAENRRDVARRKAAAAADINSMTLTCILCPNSCEISYTDAAEPEFSGYKCPKGLEYAKTELTAPVRTLTSTVTLTGSSEGYISVSVRTSRPIPKSTLVDAMKKLRRFTAEAPVSCGDVLISDFICPGTDLIATASHK